MLWMKKLTLVVSGFSELPRIYTDNIAYWKWNNMIVNYRIFFSIQISINDPEKQLLFLDLTFFFYIMLSDKYLTPVDRFQNVGEDFDDK